MDEGQGNPWDAPDDAAPDEPTAPTDPPADAPSDDPADPATPATPPVATLPTDDDEDPNRNKVIVIALGAFLAIALVGFLLSRGGSDGTVGTSGTTTVPGSSQTAPQQLAITGTIDAFTRPDSKDQLGSLPNGSKWSVEQGGWGITGATAYVANPDLQHRNIAWVGTGYATGQAQVKVATMAPQAGLVFRYAGPCSYWAVESSPAVASWNVVKVDKCKATNMGNTGYTPVNDGVTVGVRFEEKTVTIVVNGKVVKTIDDDSLAGAGKVGMVVNGAEAGKVRFDDFVAGGLKGQGIVKPAADGTGGGTKPGSTTTTPAGTTPTTTK